MSAIRKAVSTHADTLGGLFLLAFGLLVVWKGSQYPLGTLNHLGPGAFPLGVGVVLCGFALGVIFSSSDRADEPPRVSFRAFFFVLLGMLAWALLAPRFGLVPATIALVMISTFAQRPFHLRTAALVALVLSAGGVLVFLQGLRIPLAAIDW